MTEVMLNGLRTCLRPVADDSERVRAAEILMADDLGLFALPIDDPDHCLWLVIDKAANTAIGAACVGDPQDDGSRGYWLVMDPAHRGSGLGTEAMHLGLGGLRRTQTLRLLIPAEQTAVLAWLRRFDLEFIEGEGQSRTEVRAACAPAPMTGVDTQAYRAHVHAMCESLGVPTGAREAALNAGPVVEPVELACVGRDRFGRQQWLVPGAREAFERMREAAQREGIELELISGFRNAAYQCRLVRKKLERGEDWDSVLRYSALPGFSEHHSGCALDLAAGEPEVLESGFENTSAYAWLQRRAGEFGFSLSYPKDNAQGMAFEPWHWRWSGGA